MTTRVAIGCSSWRDYQFLAPFSGLLWRERIGFDPIFLLTGNWAGARRHDIAADALRKFGFKTVELPAMEGYEEATLAQNARQHAAALQFIDGDDWVMPSDADLWPIKKDFYQAHLAAPPGTAVAYYANGDHYQTYPTCHMTMRARDWRRIYTLSEGAPISPQVKRSLDGWLPTYRQRWPWNDRNFAVWMSDQAMMTDKVRDSKIPVQHVERRGHPPVERIDRGNWQPLTPAIVDSHLLRPADQPENWPRVRELFAQLLPEHVAWADEYREAYLKGY